MKALGCFEILETLTPNNTAQQLFSHLFICVLA